MDSLNLVFQSLYIKKFSCWFIKIVIEKYDAHQVGLEWHLLIPGDICWYYFMLLEYPYFYHFQVFYFFQLKGIHIMIIVHVIYLNKTVTCYSIRNVRIWVTGSTYTVFTMLPFDLKIEKCAEKSLRVNEFSWYFQVQRMMPTW